MKEIGMKAAGYKEEKPKAIEGVQQVQMVGDQEEVGKMCYPSAYINKKEFKDIDDLEQDGMYVMQALVRIAGKNTADKNKWDGGGSVQLEIQKLGFAKAKGTLDEKEFAEMNENEQDEVVRKTE